MSQFLRATLLISTLFFHVSGQVTYFVPSSEARTIKVTSQQNGNTMNAEWIFDGLNMTVLKGFTVSLKSYSIKYYYEFLFFYNISSSTAAPFRTFTGTGSVQTIQLPSRYLRLQFRSNWLEASNGFELTVSGLFSTTHPQCLRPYETENLSNLGTCACSPGFHFENGACVCTAGNYIRQVVDRSLNRTNYECIACSDREFGSAVNQFSCLKCASDKQPNLARTKCDCSRRLDPMLCACEEGFQPGSLWDPLQPSPTTCYPCPPQRYRNSMMSYCDFCPNLGSSSNGIVCDQCIGDAVLENGRCKCLPGYADSWIYNSTTNSYKIKCTPCDVNFYRSDDKDYCSICPYGSSTRGRKGATKCTCNNPVMSFVDGRCKCPPGFQENYYSYDNIECKKCPVDHFSLNNGFCQECPDGYSTGRKTGATSCDECASGFYTSSSGLCERCPMNTYSLGGNSTECLRCPAHSSTQQRTGLSKCTCREGYDMVNGTCQPCPVDYYDSLGKNEVQAIYDGPTGYDDDEVQSQSQIRCKPCPPNSGTGGMVGATACSCSGNYIEDQTGTCVEMTSAVNSNRVVFGTAVGAVSTIFGTLLLSRLYSIQSQKKVHEQSHLQNGSTISEMTMSGESKRTANDSEIESNHSLTVTVTDESSEQTEKINGENQLKLNVNTGLGLESALNPSSNSGDVSSDGYAIRSHWTDINSSDGKSVKSPKSKTRNQ